jgi:hypothetical protein
MHNGREWTNNTDKEQIKYLLEKLFKYWGGVDEQARFNGGGMNT